MDLFGYTITMNIVQSVKPPDPMQGSDTLIFTQATNGQFSVKKAYGLLKGWGDLADPQLKALWNMIWGKGNIPPRVRIHIWKLLNSALPLGAVIHRRIPAACPNCQICGQDEESPIHHALKCQFSRLCHFLGPLALKTDLLTGSLMQVFQVLGSQMDDSQWSLFAGSLWALWRCRNEGTYGGKKPEVAQFNLHLQSIMREIQMSASHPTKTAPPATRTPGSISQHYDWVCFVDGSWQEIWNGGMGICLFHKGELVKYRSAKASASCPLAVEALALLAGVQMVKELGIQECSFYSDCKNLVESVSHCHPPTETDWRAFVQVLKAWEEFQANTLFQCYHIDRDGNGIADVLAKKGRIYGWDYIGFTFPCFGI